MRTAILIVALILGACAATRSITVALVIWAVGLAVHRKAGPRDEEAFVVWLMVLGALGAVSTFAQYLWQKLTS